MSSSSPQVTGVAKKRKYKPLNKTYKYIAVRLKTELCLSFSESGSCPFGDKCAYAHGSAELRPFVRPNQRKDIPCPQFHNPPFMCRYGRRCRYSHDTPLERPAAPPPAPVPSPVPAEPAPEPVPFLLPLPPPSCLIVRKPQRPNYRNRRH